MNEASDGDSGDAVAAAATDGNNGGVVGDGDNVYTSELI